MDKEMWHKAYMERLIEVTKCPVGFAQEALDAGMDDFDYEDDPKDAADLEISYWSD
jgi:hypothetical protein